MDVEVVVQRMQPREDESIYKKLADVAALFGRVDINVAVAYATVAGVRQLLNVIPRERRGRTRWLLGLDDELTQPGAIDLIRRLENSEVRVPRNRQAGLRFHPKVYYFHSEAPAARDVLAMGSANLTKAALTGNAEALVVMLPPGGGLHPDLSRAWTALWNQGIELTEDALRNYRARYKAARRRRRAEDRAAQAQPVLPRPRGGELISDASEVDPKGATTCWIEVGRNTALGRELEFKAEQVEFFGLAPRGGPAEVFTFLTSDGARVPLRIKYQAANSMWRLQMNDDVPEVPRGLRPRDARGLLGRSEYVAVITRTGEDRVFRLRFINERSDAYRRIRHRTWISGTIGRTTTRRFGWC